MVVKGKWVVKNNMRTHIGKFALVVCLCCWALLSQAAVGVLSPAIWTQDDAFKTLSSEHFDVHFARSQHALAQRALAIAEQVHLELMPFFQSDLHARTQMVLTDDVDFSNGWATVSEYAQIRLFVSPPEDVNTLESYDEWLHMLIRHEYTHILHMEMVRGAPKALQRVFGRHPILFPHALLSSLFLEGVAVHKESNPTQGYGRLTGSQYRMRMRMEVASGNLATLSEAIAPLRRPPRGKNYLYGAYFVQYLIDRFGEETFKRYLTLYSGRFFLFQNHVARTVFGRSFDQLWAEFRVHLIQRFQPEINNLKAQQVSGKMMLRALAQMPAAITDEGFWVYQQSAVDKPMLAHYQHSNMAEHDATLDVRGIQHMDWHPTRGLAFTRYITYANGQVFGDVFVRSPNGDVERLTKRQRFRKVRWVNDQWLLASRKVAGISELWLMAVDAPDERVRLWRGQPNEVLGGFDVSPDGARMVACVKAPNQRWNLALKALPPLLPRVNERDAQGDGSIKQLDAALNEHPWQWLTHSASVENTPTFIDNHNLVFSADYDGVFNLYRQAIDSQAVKQLTRELSGAFHPMWHPRHGLWYQTYAQAGYELRHLNITHTDESSVLANVSDIAAPDAFVPVGQVLADTQMRDYSPWSSLAPRSWWPRYFQAKGGFRVGVHINGHDALHRHGYDLVVEYDRWANALGGELEYVFDQRWQARWKRFYRTPIVSGLHRNLTLANDDVSLLRRNLFSAWEDQLHWHIGAQWSHMQLWRGSEHLAAPLDPVHMVQLGTQWTFTNTRTLRDVPGIGYGTQWDVSYDIGRILDKDSDTQRVQGRWQTTFDLPSTHSLSLRVDAGRAWQRTFELGGIDTIAQDSTLFSGNSKALEGFKPSAQRGNTFARTRLTWRSLLGRIEKNWSVYPLGFGDVSASVFAQSGSAWQSEQSSKPVFAIGAEMVTELVLNYRFALPLSLGAARGLSGEHADTQLWLRFGFFY